MADLRRRNLRVVAVIFQRPYESEGAGDVVISDDQRDVQFVVNVVVDLAQVFCDRFEGPAFKWAAQVNADELAQHASVDAFQIIRR